MPTLSKTGNLESLKLLHKFNFEYLHDIVTSFAKRYHLDCVKYMLSNNFYFFRSKVFKKLNYRYSKIDIDDVEWRKILFSFEKDCARFPNLYSIIVKKKSELEQIKKTLEELLVVPNLICEDVFNYCIIKYV